VAEGRVRETPALTKAVREFDRLEEDVVHDQRAVAQPKTYRYDLGPMRERGIFATIRVPIRREVEKELKGYRATRACEERLGDRIV